MSNRTINRLREIYEQTRGGFQDFGWKDDPTVQRSGEETLLTRNADGTITAEQYSRAKRFSVNTYPNEEAAVDYYIRALNITEDDLK